MIYMLERYFYLYMVVWMGVWEPMIMSEACMKKEDTKIKIKAIIHKQTCEVRMHWGNKAKRANQDHDTKTLQVAFMVDCENISSTWSASLTHKEQ